MAPAKREFDDMMFDYDPVFEIDIVTHGFAEMSRPVKRCKDVDLTRYVVASDDEFDAVVPTVEQLEFQVRQEDALAQTMAKNPFMCGRGSYDTTTIQEKLDMVTTSFDDWASDMSSEDSEDTGYHTMFNSPAHVLDAQYDVPFTGLDADSLAEAAEQLLTEVDSPASVEDVVRAITESASSSRESSMTPDEIREELDLEDDDEAPPAHMVTKTGKPVNPTRWAHNSTERKRRLEIRKLFSGLRDLFPEIQGDDKVSNITTLNRAIDHVEELKVAVAEQEESLEEMRAKNVLLRQRAEEALARRKIIDEARENDDTPPEALAVLEGSADPELRKTLPAALRQLLDHNSRGPTEKAPLQRRRVKPVSTSA